MLTGQPFKVSEWILVKLWLSGHALTASPTSYSHFPHTLLVRNHLGPALETYFPTEFQSLHCNSVATSSLDPVLPAMSLPKDPKLEVVSVLTKDTQSIRQPSIPIFCFGRGGTSLQVATWFIEATHPAFSSSSSVLQFLGILAATGGSEIIVYGHSHNLHWQHLEYRMIQPSHEMRRWMGMEMEGQQPPLSATCEMTNLTR